MTRRREPPGGAAAVDADRVAARLARVRERIAAAGGDPGTTVVAVTKGFGPEAVRAALAAGITDVGESYAQELRRKADALGVVVPRWHFVGRLQSNKVRLVAADVAMWQSVDRGSLGPELAGRAPGARVLAQVNVSGEAQKGGCAPDGAPALVGALLEVGLDVVGLMAVGASGPPEAARPGFRLLASLADRLGLAERSMGMSSDLEVAVQEGATIVRVGSALFGARPRP